MVEHLVIGVFFNDNQHKTKLTALLEFFKLVFSHWPTISDGLFCPSCWFLCQGKHSIQRWLEYLHVNFLTKEAYFFYGYEFVKGACSSLVLDWNWWGLTFIITFITHYKPCVWGKDQFHYTNKYASCRCVGLTLHSRCVGLNYLGMDKYRNELYKC
jgi:hypothetical protein